MFPSLSFRGMCIRVGGVGVWDPLILLSLSAVCRDLVVFCEHPLLIRSVHLLANLFLGKSELILWDVRQKV